jgi:uncharacterized SAM-binding protein YcdF (DUF218 family)
MDKLVIALLSPLGTALALGVVALLLARLNVQRWAWRLGALAVLWLGVWSLPVASHALRGWVEAPYPALAVEQLPQAQAVVVLGGAIRPAEPGQLWPDMQSSADRVWHGARLYHAGKAPLVVLTGGSNPALSATSEAEAMRLLLRDMGVPESALLLEERSRNTRQNAAFTAEILKARGISSVLLVTSALHMRRAVALFEAEGLVVTPAAADHETRTQLNAVDWLPSADALDGSARAMKELVGRVTGR